MSFCSNCGKEINPKFLFCQYCGAKVEILEAKPHEPSGLTEEELVSGRMVFQLKWFFLSPLIFLVLLWFGPTTVYPEARYPYVLLAFPFYAQIVMLFIFPIGSLWWATRFLKERLPDLYPQRTIVVLTIATLIIPILGTLVYGAGLEFYLNTKPILTFYVIALCLGTYLYLGLLERRAGARVMLLRGSMMKMQRLYLQPYHATEADWAQFLKAFTTKDIKALMGLGYLVSSLQERIDKALAGSSYPEHEKPSQPTLRFSDFNVAKEVLAVAQGCLRSREHFYLGAIIVTEASFLIMFLFRTALQELSNFTIWLLVLGAPLLLLMMMLLVWDRITQRRGLRKISKLLRLPLD